MRDILLIMLAAGLLPIALARPWVGALTFAVISFMNPHRATWGVAYELPFAMVFAIATILGLFLEKSKSFSFALKDTKILLVYSAWTCVTTFFALNLADSMIYLERYLKIILFIFVTASLLTTRERIWQLIWVAALSIGFYGTKGGFFTLIHLGDHRVWGPPESVIEDNNHLAAALLITIPLLLALRNKVENQWAKLALLGSVALCAFSVFGSHSRGAFLSIGVTSLFLILKSNKKLISFLLVSIALFATLALLPDHWFARMNTIKDYQEDASSVGRLTTWETAFNIANQHITGGGFNWYSGVAFATYGPPGATVHSSHSIYFQALGEHGWIGLLLWSSFWISVWIATRRTIEQFTHLPNYRAEVSLMKMFQVSMIAFGTAGAFVNIGNWDMMMTMGVAILAMRRVMLNEQPPSKRIPSPL